MRPLRLAALWKLIGWALVAAVVVGSLVPPPRALSLDVSDKLMHLLAYAVLALWFGAIYERGRFSRIGILLLTLGVAIEFAQALTRTRSFEFADMIADGLGTAVGLLAAATPVGGLLLLFEKQLPPVVEKDGWRPLADRMRPHTLDEFVGQAHILGPDKPLRRALESGRPHSMIFWGPPGTGKTTLAQLLARSADMEFTGLSAVMAGVKEIRAAVAAAQAARENGRRTLLLVDEVHRFNKAQQDALLPHVEDGTFVLVGATTENPSFEVNNALLSRCRVYVLKTLGADDLARLLGRALVDRERGLGERNLAMPEALREKIAQAADGDARRALNLLDLAADVTEARGSREVAETDVAEVISGGLRRFDKGGEYFYDLVSALHKSVRGSDPDAALYWFARMLDGGVDPHYLARRVLRIASEDIGNADPRALNLALDAWNTYERLGSPEGELAIAQAVVYLAVAPKSNAVYEAFNTAMDDVRKHGTLEVPVQLRNAPTRLMKSLDYGKGYRYAHNEPGAFAEGEAYLPDELAGRIYYNPPQRGLEIRIAEKLAELRERNRRARKKES